MQFLALCANSVRLSYYIFKLKEISMEEGTERWQHHSADFKRFTLSGFKKMKAKK
jgi:hypothetical protein